MKKIGVLLCGHGSKLQKGVEGFKKFAKGFQEQFQQYETLPAFFHFSEPDLDEGVQQLVDKGVNEIVVLPLFLFTGAHLQDDISCMMYQASKRHGIPIRMGNYMGVCDEMVDIAEQNIRAVVPDAVLQQPENTMLVVAGVGSSRVEANADIASIVRLVQERLRLPFATLGFLSRKTFPSIEQTMPTVGHLPQGNVIVLPYMFFKGAYLDRVHSAIEQFEKEHTEKQVFCADTLVANTGLYEVLKMRLQEVLDGKVDFIETMDKEVMEKYTGHHHDHCGGHDHHHHHHHGDEHHHHHHGDCHHHHGHHHDHDDHHGHHHHGDCKH